MPRVPSFTKITRGSERLALIGRIVGGVASGAVRAIAEWLLDDKVIG